MRLACLKSLTTLLAGVALLASSEVGAQITYNVNLGIGGGTAVGQITTNGTIGSVGAADLTSFSILLSPSPGSQFTLTNFNAGVDGTQNLLASASELSFDFSSVGYFLFQNPNPGSGINYLCFTNILCGGNDVPGMTMGTNAFGQNFTPLSGRQVVATAAITTVPEPSTYALMASGLLAIAVVAQRRRKV